MRAGAAVHDHGGPVAELGLHMGGTGRADAPGAIGARRRDRHLCRGQPSAGARVPRAARVARPALTSSEMAQSERRLSTSESGPGQKAPASFFAVALTTA